MEEKNKKKASVKNDEKIPYEQLEQIANNLNNRCKQLYQNLQEAQSVISNFNDVGMLLSILEKGEYFSSDFTERCAKKVEDVVTLMLDNSEKTESNTEN